MILSLSVSKSSAQIFECERISQEETIQLNGVIDEVFPLFGPIKEMDWAPGWSPEILFTTTGEVEEHMIFKTKEKFEGEGDYIWVVSQFAPKQFFIEYTISTKERIWFVRVQCSAQEGTTIAKVKYTYTGLTNQGNALNRIALGKMFERNLKDWEEAINHYLHTGEKLISN